MTARTTDVVVVGGGITGCAAAYAIAKSGARVTLLEARGIAAMGSGWSLGGVRQSGRHPAELPLALAAVQRWPTLADELGGPTEYRQKGNLRLARTEAEVVRIRALVADQKAAGLDLRFLASTTDVRALAPAISERVLAASFCPTDGHANPALTTRTFATAAARHGAIVREDVACRGLRFDNDRVVGVETSDGPISADRVVVAAGLASPRLIAPLALPMRATIVNVIQTEPIAPVLDQVFGVANADCAGRQEADGRLRVTTGVEAWHGDAGNWTEANLAPRPARVAAMLAHISYVLAPLQGAQIARTWGGLIDLTPDALPVLDSPRPGLIVASGFSGHGFGIGPVCGEIAADLALGRTSRFDLAPFRLDRFSGSAGAEEGLTLHG